MHVLQRKCLHRTLLGVKAHRNPLYRTDIVHRTFLVEIRQSDMAGLLLNRDGGDRRRHLLVRASFFSRYTSLEWLIMSSRVEPLSPLLFQVPIHALLYFHSLQILENSAGSGARKLLPLK